MFDMRELFWAAGFIEGEGSFPLTRDLARKHQSSRVMATQNEREPLERLVALFGGGICHVSWKLGTGWQWHTYGSRARGIAMTLFPLMSIRRKGQIRKMLKNDTAFPQGSAEHRRRLSVALKATWEHKKANGERWNGKRWSRNESCAIAR